MFSKILSTSSNDGYGSIRIMKMVTAPDVDISATSTAETSTSEMSTSYSTKWETKGMFFPDDCPPPILGWLFLCVLIYPIIKQK